MGRIDVTEPQDWIIDGLEAQSIKTNSDSTAVDQSGSSLS